MTRTARVFRNGASQAVRLPKEFRFDADEVCIRKIGDQLFLFPKDKVWDIWAGALGQVSNDFMTDRNQPPQQEREFW